LKTVLKNWENHFSENSDLIFHGKSFKDIEKAKSENKTAVFFGFQNCSPIEDDIGLVEKVYDLGCRFMQLTYNNQSLLATGCYEAIDSGVTNFGKEVIKEMNRLAEKDFINNLNIRTTRYVSIEKKSEMDSVEDLLPGILKTTTLGYDGKGQHPINSLENLDSIDVDYSKGYILEKLVKLKKEISIIITRFDIQKYEIYEPIENEHEDQILRNSKIPAEISDKILEQSKLWATTIAEELKYVGTLCVEFFIDRNDNLYVNEIAPRVHNSGHLTINAYNVSQFENHVRAVCKLEQIPLKKISNAMMTNIIGDQITNYRNKEHNENEFFFDYLKKEIKPKRKMGHLTTLLK
ncbi:ATP-grasp domain-containing protein, partial [Candidatus Pelagibacter ubique]|nr:ATP-grasp domain-containing protein [Candidatus Pelagibacter ubique]